MTRVRVNLSTTQTLTSIQVWEKETLIAAQIVPIPLGLLCSLRSENLILCFLVEMITGFDHGYWLTSPISTWPQTFWASTFPCLSWLLLQPCRKWLILMVQTSAKLRFSTHFSKGKFSCRNYLECRRACYGKSSSLCRNNNGLKYHTACGTSVMTQTLIHCADPMTDVMVFFFRHCPHGLLPALKRSTQLGQGYVSSSSMYALSAWTCKNHCLCSVHHTDLTMNHLSPSGLQGQEYSTATREKGRIGWL